MLDQLFKLLGGSPKKKDSMQYGGTAPERGSRHQQMMDVQKMPRMEHAPVQPQEQQVVPLLKGGYPAHYQDNTYKLQLGGGRDNYINYKKLPEEDEGFVGDPRNLNQYSPLNVDVRNFQMQPQGMPEDAGLMRSQQGYTPYNADIANFRGNGSMQGGQEALMNLLTKKLRVR